MTLYFPHATFGETTTFTKRLQATLRCPVIVLMMTSIGLIMFFEACYTDRTIARHEPKLTRIEPVIPRICFVAKSLGMMIAVAGLGATANLIA
jgi:hypothetical protein